MERINMIGLTYIMQLENISGKKLAEKLGVSQPTLSQWEKKVRPIPEARLNTLSELFPAYGKDYFQKDLEEIDKQKLEYAQKNFQIHTLDGDDMLQVIHERNRLQNELIKQETLIKQQNVIDDISLLFKNISNLDVASTSEVTFHKIVIKHFYDLCELEKKIITNFFENEDDAEAFKKSSQHIIIDIKDFSAELEDSLKFCESLIKYKNK